jgi:hypothetical protein
MVALSQTWKPATQCLPSAHSSRQTPLARKPSPATPNRTVLCARYYDPQTGEFTSPDPLEYVDGMSLYRGYFASQGIDPFGLLIKELPLMLMTRAALWNTHFAEAYTNSFRELQGFKKPHGRWFKIEEHERPGCPGCFCAIVDEEAIYYLQVQIIMPSDAIGVKWTLWGWLSVYSHERRRVSVFKYAHDEFLDETGKFGDYQLQCGVVCSNTRGEAKIELTKYVENVIEEAISNYSQYKDLHLKEITKENDRENLDYENKLFDRFKKIHRVTPPKPWILKAKCPKLKCS